ncbi:MAG: hypothetical protein E7618_04060 [Ruminococcaceae bacterium]|nr:hypothetical protein [Oscillospiraceae bacterium]
MSDTPSPKTTKRFDWEQFRTKWVPIIKEACQYIPAVLLVILYLVTISKTNFDLKSEDNADLYRMITMVLMLGLSIIMPSLKNSKVGAVIKGLFYFAYPFFSYLFLESFLHDPFAEGSVQKDTFIFLNVIVFYLLSFLFTALTTRSDVAVALTAGIPLIFGIANHMSVAFRATPIYPWDLLSFGTAMSVLDNYQLTPTTNFYFLVYAFVFMIGFGFLAGFRFKFKKWWINVATALLTVVVFFGYCGYLRSDEAQNKYGYYPYLYSATYLYKYNGSALSFIWTTQFLNLSAPSGYDDDTIEALYQDHKDQAEDTAADTDTVFPNIIVIMNEAFSDPAVLGDFTTNVDYLPFINSMTENVAKGNVLVSVKGGNTPNSEFEFLTGTSMAFLPSGSIPFQQYIKGETYSLVSHLESLGYSSVAMHPYPASGWEREEVYPRLGFDQSYFLSNWGRKSYLRGYVSDDCVFDKIIDEYEKRDTSKPFFAFAVTMQNHGSYSKQYANFTPDVRVDGVSNYNLQAYLSLMKKTDEAFEDLIAYYETVEEPTVILMYGDHQPNDNVIQPILNLNGINMNTASVEVQQTRYFTPYILWANYEAEGLGSMPETTSLNYLCGLMLSAIDMPLTPFQIWQEELRKEYPLMNANSYVDKNGNYHEAADIFEKPLLNTYAQIQYNLVFDLKHTVKDFFTPILPD